MITTKPWSEEEIKRLQVLAEDKSFSEVAKLLGRTSSSVSTKYHRLFGRKPASIRVCISCSKEFRSFGSTAKVCEDCRDMVHRQAVIKNNTSEYGRYYQYWYSAERRGVPFDITLDEFLSLWQKPCTYCGGEIATIGLDRVNNSLGYSLDNVLPCCKVCNTMKMDTNLDEWLIHIKKIIKNIGGSDEF